MDLTTDSRPIGVFDSGLGGLTVLKALCEAFPKESFVYLGDTARVPYGNKSPQLIRQYGEEIIRFLKEKQNVKAVVIACNSASSQFPETEFLGLPLITVIEPGCLMALKATTNKRIGVIGTRATIGSQTYEKSLKKIEATLHVVSQACPLFVPLVEENWIDDPVTNLIVFRYLDSLKKENIDTLILGCTHYPMLSSAIRRVMGNGVTLVESGRAVADKIQSLFDHGVFHPSPSADRLDYFSTDLSDQNIQLAKKWMSPITFHQFGPADLLKP